MPITPPDAVKPSPFERDARFALIANDLPEMRLALQTVLKRRGFVVLTAYDGAEAVETAPMFPFSVIVVGLDMPRMGGIEAARRIRALGGSLARIPILALSGGEPRLAKTAWGEAGIDAFVPNEAGLEPLARALDRLVGCAGGCPPS